MAISSEDLRQRLLSQILNQPTPQSAAQGISNLGASLAAVISGRRIADLKSEETADKIGDEVRIRDALISSGIGSRQASAIASAPQGVRGALLARMPTPIEKEVQEARLGEIRERTAERRAVRKQGDRERAAVQSLAQRVLSGEFGDLDQGQRLDALVAAFGFQ